MAVTDLRHDDTDPLAELAQQIGKFQDSLIPAITLDAARAAVKAAGVRAKSDLYLDELEAFRQAQEAKRMCDVSVNDDRRTLADALAEAEWTLGGCFEARSNKQWLTRDVDGTAIAEDDQRSFTADEKKAWLARAADKLPAVATAQRQLALTEEAARAAIDQVVLVERRLTAARHLLDASVAELETYRLALTAPNRKETNR